MEQKLDAIYSRLGAFQAVSVDSQTPVNGSLHRGSSTSERPNQGAQAQSFPSSITPRSTMAEHGERCRFQAPSTTPGGALSPTVATPGASIMPWFPQTSWTGRHEVATPSSVGRNLQKRKWHGFELSAVPVDDFVGRALVSETDAMTWFRW